MASNFTATFTFGTHFVAMLNKIVRVNPDFFLEQFDDEIVVYHPSLTTSIYFNETGALIWQLCDGQRTVGEIIDILSRQYPEAADLIDNEVVALVQSLVERQVAELV